MVGVMHFYFLGLDSLFLKRFLTIFNFNTFMVKKILKVILKSILPLGLFQLSTLLETPNVVICLRRKNY